MEADRGSGLSGYPARRPECRPEPVAGADLDAGIAEPLGERTVCPCNQNLGLIESGEAANEQLGLSFTAAVSLGQVDMRDLHDGGMLPSL